ncbi:MAG: transporter [Syntrophobacteraceae bacterium]|nr:transporter [Syntrophobacteraceae bacterium]
MKKFFMAVCVCLAIFTMVGSAFAEELWDWHLRGADEGLAYGALPPAGLYFINDFYWLGNWNGHDNGGHTTGAKINGYVDVPILLWNPGLCPILGATYSAAIAQPFDSSILRVPATGGFDSATGSQWGTYNTILVPFILSWEIPCNLHVAASMQIGLNDGTTSPGDSLASITKHPGDLLASKNFSPTSGNLYAWSASNNYSFSPTIGISWLYEGWNIGAEFMYTFWTKDSDCQYQNGDQLYADYTLTYTCGKWTFGLGAEGTNQLYNDKGNFFTPSGYVYGKLLDTCNVNYTAGPIVGYNFGPCSLLFTYNFQLTTKNDVGGDWAMLRLVVPLGNPCDWYK